ncbi:MAG: AAA family ATPase [Acinetobacter sp.]|jgi:predicted ATP-binding protein involved in virulence|uniref:AAA family ATPase n=1 Tax=Acinetobacter johnsonii TaxID=40214 RepID=UPI00265285D0|nr:AAA family ATPase [Acinetobacter sp.]
MKYIQKISAKLDFLNHDLNIDLKGRNLILTGKNGVGKTRFLNQLNSVALNKLIHEIPHLSQQHYSCKERIINIISSEIQNISPNLIFQQHLEELTKLLIKTDSYNIIENKKFVEIAKKLKAIIIQNQGLSNDENYRYRHSQIHEIEHYFNELGYMNSHENIDLVVTGIGNLSENIQASKVTFNFFPAHRQSQITASTNTTDLNQYINTAKHEYSSKLGQFLEQYLLNIKIEKSLALSEEQDTDHADQIDEWFTKFDEDLKFLFEDSTTQLKFNYKLRKFSLLQSYREFTFQSLSSGFTAIFDIYSDLLMRSRLLNILPNELNGVVLIDEIDAHLHISLQKKILPFLSQSFPEIQFIVSTHSPFVIASTNNDTVVYDLSTGEFFEEDLSLYSHESIIKELFHVKDDNENLKRLSNQLLQFINSENSIQDLNLIQGLLDDIKKDFEKLSVELQLQYMVAKNKLHKLKHEGK